MTNSEKAQKARKLAVQAQRLLHEAADEDDALDWLDEGDEA